MTKDRNRLVVLESYPQDGDKFVYAEKPVFKLIFDNKLNSGNIRDEVKVVDSKGVEIPKGTRSVQINKISKPYGDIIFELTEPLTVGEKYKLLISGNAMDDDGIIAVDPLEINFTAANVLVTDKTVVEDFDVKDKFAYDEENSSNCSKAAFVRNTSQKLFGAANYRMSVDYSDVEGEALFNYSENIVTSEENKVFGLHLYGDMSGNELQLVLQEVDDAIGELLYLPLTKIDFVGWVFREVEVPFNKPYRLIGMKLVRQESILSASSQFWVDDLLLYQEPITGFANLKADNIGIYPNPTKDIIHVNTESQKAPTLQLYSLNGVLLKTVIANQIQVSEFDSGTYLLKVITEEGSFGKVVMKQ